VTKLVENGADPNARTGPPHKTALQVAASAGTLAVMEVLVRKGADWRAKDDWGWKVQHEAAASGCQAVIKWTFSRSVSGNDDPDRLGRSPLLVALMSGVGCAAVEELLLQGADPGLVDEVGRTCPEAAVLYCSPHTVRVVLDACIAKKVEMDKTLLLELARDRENNMDMVDTINSCCNLVYIKQTLLELETLSMVTAQLKLC
jgi:ankyrin repeat protein